MLHRQLSTGEWLKNGTPKQIDSIEYKKKQLLLFPLNIYRDTWGPMIKQRFEVGIF